MWELIWSRAMDIFSANGLCGDLGSREMRSMQELNAV
jgi:hypothetical protein